MANKWYHECETGVFINKNDSTKSLYNVQSPVMLCLHGSVTNLGLTYEMIKYGLLELVNSHEIFAVKSQLEGAPEMRVNFCRIGQVMTVNYDRTAWDLRAHNPRKGIGLNLGS